MNSDAFYQRTVRDCVCAHCWGNLVLHADKITRWRIECPACGPDIGQVSKSYAEQRRAESRGEKVEVEQMLQAAGILPKPEPRSEDEILSELGF